MQKVAIIGADGNLGGQLIKDFSKYYPVIGTCYEKELENMIYLDITDKEEVSNFLKKENPDIILLTSAMTNVGACEINPKQAMEINYFGVENIVNNCKNRKLVFYSTDAIFDGTKKEYVEEDIPNPINIYGKSKLKAENLVKTLPSYLICRTSRFYGPGGNKFVNKMIDILEKGEELKAPINTTGSITFIEDISRATLELVKKQKTGIYHIVSEGAYSLDEIAFKIANIFEFNASLITVVETDYFNTEVKRANVVLNTSKFKKEKIKMSTLEEGLEKLK